MDNKSVSLNLVLRKKGSPDALKSVSATVAEPSCKGASETAPPSQGHTPPDTSETPANSELTDAERALLAKQAPDLPWEESPGWEALMVWSRVLSMHVWLVRDWATGNEYARETSTPALVLAEVVELRGIPTEEARAFLLDRLIAPGGVQ